MRHNHFTVKQVHFIDHTQTIKHLTVTRGVVLEMENDRERERARDRERERERVHNLFAYVLTFMTG